LRFLHSQGRCKFAGGDASNPPPKNFGNHNGGISGAIDAKIGELIRGETLRMKRPEAGLVAEERPARHSHATREKDVDRSVQPDDRDAGIAQEFGGARLGIGASAESNDGGFMELDSAAERATQLLSFELAKSELAVAFEKFGDRDAGGLLDAFVEIDKVPPELAGEAGANSAFASAHETGETDDGDARLRSAADWSLIHDSGKRD
jgi:hypothetical protein